MDQREAEVISEHLPQGYTAGIDEDESSLRLQGGDIHRDLYKIDARSRLQQRAATFSHPIPSETPVAEQRAPGGFRRHFVRKHAVPLTRNFVEFLELYGSFAGEDLAERDEESTPLLGRRKGDAGTVKSLFTLLKAFIGTGIMFLPKAFNNGGILFSSITLILVSVISMLAFHLLLQCRNRYGGGYGEIGQEIGGRKMRSVILGSITISQIGFVCAGIVFVAENLYAFLDAVANPVSIQILILIQLLVLIPLAFIRNISKLGPVALLADIFILVGLAYIYYYDIATIADRGIEKSVTLFNARDYTLTIGAAIFTFEGIGLILPIQSSMKKPERFEPLLFSVMLIITIIFTSVGVLCYATFGAATQIEIISNYPQDNKFVNAVQFLYSLAVLVGTPVQLFPALRILEGKLFGQSSGKNNEMTKWKKNGFRTATVILCGVISILGSNNLDRFVALIGSVACVPLVYIYPPLLHYKGIAKSRWTRLGDIFLMGIGIVAMFYTAVITIVNSFTQ